MDKTSRNTLVDIQKEHTLSLHLLSWIHRSISIPENSKAVVPANFSTTTKTNTAWYQFCEASNTEVLE